jgi:hypothetical protein
MYESSENQMVIPVFQPSPYGQLLSEAEAAGLSEPFSHPDVIKGLLFLSSQLTPHCHEYNTLLIDDTSGRLPGIVIRGVMNARRTEMGMSPIVTRFANGASTAALPDTFMPRPEQETERVLIFTEYVSTGEAVQNLYQAVRRYRHNQQADIAILGGSHIPIANLPYTLGNQSMNVFSNLLPEFRYIDQQLCRNIEVQAAKGVVKNGWTGRFARKQPPEYYDGATVKKARRDARTLAALITKVLP